LLSSEEVELLDIACCVSEDEKVPGCSNGWCWYEYLLQKPVWHFVVTLKLTRNNRNLIGENSSKK